MSRPAQAPEASMEDILASIRKIITEDAGDIRAQAVAKPQAAKPIQLKPAAAPTALTTFAADIERELSRVADEPAAAGEEDIFELPSATATESKPAILKPAATVTPIAPVVPKPAVPVAAKGIDHPVPSAAAFVNGSNGFHTDLASAEVAVVETQPVDSDDILGIDDDAPIELTLMAEPSPPAAVAAIATEPALAAVDPIDDAGVVADLGAPIEVEIAAPAVETAVSAVASVAEVALPAAELSPPVAVVVAAPVAETVALPVILQEDLAPVVAAEPVAEPVVEAALPHAAATEPEFASSLPETIVVSQPEAVAATAESIPMQAPSVEAPPAVVDAEASPQEPQSAIVAAVEHATIVRIQTLEDEIAGMMKPMIKDWLDANMPRIVAKALAKDLASD